MADRTCPRCGAAASPRLKFCRDCGGRLEEAPDAPATPPVDSGDETIVSGMAAVGRGGGGGPPEEEDDGDAGDPGDQTIISGMKGPAVTGADAPLGGTGTKTIVGGMPAAAEPPAAGVPDTDGDETLVAGFRRPSPPPAEDEDDSRSTETFVGTVPPGMADPTPPPPPPPPAPDPADLEEPVTDDFDLGDDASGATLMAPPPVPPAPPPPPPPPSGAALRLDHWSPSVKGDAVTLGEGETLVGRDRGDLKFPDDHYLSKKHGRFYRDDEGRLCVEDLGTLNGTFLRVRTPMKLEHRDVLAVGRHVFRFEILKYEEKDDRTIEGDPLTRVQGVQGSTPRARLVKRQEEGFSGIPFFFGTHRYVLGRTEGTHRFTRDDLMSRRHAAVTYRDGDYWLEDLGSQNGTFLRLRGPLVLQPGDVIRMGDQYFKHV